MQLRMEIFKGMQFIHINQFSQANLSSDLKLIPPHINVLIVCSLHIVLYFEEILILGL